MGITSTGYGTLATPLLLLLLPFVVAFSATSLLVPQVRRFAITWRLGDKPNGRKLHARAIPHLGGIAIFGGFFLALLLSLGLQGGVALGQRVLALLPGLLILFGLGIVDDLRGLRASSKLLYQSLGAILVVAMGAGLPLEGTTPLVWAGLACVGVLWYVGVCNSVNLIDGLDGLAAGTSAISAVAFLAVGWHAGEPAVALVAVSLLGALLAFLRFNFHPARIFMGDTGSMFIGFSLAFMGILLVRNLGFWPALLGGATVLGVPILDTTTAVCRRLLAGRHIFQADGEHTHHKLMAMGFTHRGSVVVLYGLAAAFASLGSAILLGRVHLFGVAVTLALLAVIAIEMGVRRRAAPRAHAVARPRVALPDVAEPLAALEGSAPAVPGTATVAETPPAWVEPVGIGEANPMRRAAGADLAAAHPFGRNLPPTT